MPPLLRLRLSALMFAQYGLMGLWSVTLATFLKASPHDGGLGLAATNVSLIYMTLALAATVSPLMVGLIADRFFATQRVLAGLHLAGAIILFVAARTGSEYQESAALAFQKVAFATDVADDGELWRLLWERDSLRNYVADPTNYPFSEPRIRGWVRTGLGHVGIHVPWDHRVDHPNVWRSEDVARRRLSDLDAKLPAAVRRACDDPSVAAMTVEAVGPLFALMLAYNLCYLPTITLSSALAFRNLPNPARQFGQVRAWGTVGWMVAGWTVGGLLPQVSVLPLALASLGSAIMSGLCLLQPNTPPALKPRTLSDTLGLPALRLLTDRSFLVFALTSLAGSFLMAFHNLFTHPYLVDLGVRHAAAWQTLGQTTEVLCILLIPRLCERFGTKAVLFAGMTASGCRFFGYAVGVPWVVLAIGLPLHGVGFALYYVTAAVYVDTRAPQDLRASAQGLVTLITAGVGALAGNIFAGHVVDWDTVGGTVEWQAVWLVPAIGTFAAAAFFALTFHQPTTTARDLVEPPPELIEPPA
ncbi:MAG: MFS transporter [Gemmataceae bacterium]